MLFRTSLLALVSCGNFASSGAPPRQLLMWNTKARSSIHQLQFRTPIHGVKMNHKRLVVLLDREIHIFELKTMKILHVIERKPLADPSLGWLCASSERGYLATPLALGGQGLHAWQTAHPVAGFQEGSSCEARSGFVTIVDTYTLRPVGTVLAHRCPVQALCLNPTGQLLASASAKGTVVRVFSVPALDVLCCFRRGASVCRIFGLLFSRDSAYICASAASGTVHIFRNSEQKLGTLPLQSEEATVGAAQREMMLQASPGAHEGSSTLEARGQPQSQSVPAAIPEIPSPTAPALDELEDWTEIAERPDRLLELTVGSSSGSSSTSRSGSMLQALSAASGLAVESTAKYAKPLLLQLLPQACKEPKAFAWVHLREEDPRKDASEGPNWAEALLSRLPGLADGHPAHGRYIACVCSDRGPGQAEVLVATARGCVQIYEWNQMVGGECTLRTEHSFSEH